MVQTSFQRMLNILRGEAAELGASEIYEAKQKIEKLVDREQAKVFKLLARKGIDVSGPPNLGRFTKQWAPLTNNARGRYPGYLDWKKKHGYSKNFYMKTGALKKEVTGVSPISLLGDPLVSASPGGVVRTTEGFREITIERTSSKGKQFFIKQTREALTGRFGSASKRGFRYSAFLSVSPVPKLRGVDLEDEKKTAAALFGDQSLTYWKFTNPREQTKRPLLGAFLNWWIQVDLRAKIDRITA